jgi:DnaJ-class molecular chaperone
MNFGGMGGGMGGGGIEDLLGQMFSGGGMGGGMGGMPRQPSRQAPRQQPKAATINVGLDLTMAQAEEGGEFTFSYKRFKRQGTSMETKRTTMKLRLNPGATHGTTKTLKGQGHDHPEGERGDVVVSVRIDAGEAYRWEGDQLIMEVPVPYSIMMLGGKVSVKLLSGKTGKLSVDPLTQVGDRRRMGKAGYNGGDLTLEFVLEEPEELTEEQRKALKDLGSTGL